MKRIGSCPRGDVPPITQVLPAVRTARQVGQILGCSHTAIQQVEARAWRKIVDRMKDPNFELREPDWEKPRQDGFTKELRLKAKQRREERRNRK